MVDFDAGFDSGRYEDEVLKPLRRRMPNLPDDLLVRYAVEPGMDAQRLRERVGAVQRVWNKHAMRTSPLGQVCKQLQRAHDELKATKGDPATPQFWTVWLGTRASRVSPQIDQVAARLRAGHGSLGVITAEQLRANAVAHDGLVDADLDRARELAGLRLVEPVPLPAATEFR